MPGQEKMPPETWPITKDDKVIMRELGRKLNLFLLDHFKGHERVHMKHLAGAFQYIMEMQKQKANVVGDDFMLATKVVNQNDLSTFIEEPFEIEPDLPEPTIEERREALRLQMSDLDTEEAASDVGDASPAPSATAAPAPVEEPAVEEPAVEEPAVEEPAVEDISGEESVQG